MDPDAIDDLRALQKAHVNLHAEVGLVASGWAMIEFQINQCIWMLAKLNPVAGACITAQIISMAPRLDCLLALMKLRSIDHNLIGRVEKFKQNIYGTQEKRNRMVHDPFVYNRMTRKAGKIEITAKGTPVFRVKEVSLSEVNELHKEILRRQETLGDILASISALRDTLPDIPQPDDDPTQVTMVLDAQSPSSG